MTEVLAADPLWVRRVEDRSAAPDLVDRILDAAVTLVSRWGVAKTTLADVAKVAGCSRATLYRTFPGGKAALLDALARRELRTQFGLVVDAVDAADDLADAATRALVVASRLVRDHEAVQYLLAHEPGVLLSYLGFRQGDPLYSLVASVVGPHFARFVAPDRAAWLAEWLTRTLLTYVFEPAGEVDLSSIDDARRIVERYLLPAFPAPTSPIVHPA